MANNGIPPEGARVAEGDGRIQKLQQDVARASIGHATDADMALLSRLFQEEELSEEDIATLEEHLKQRRRELIRIALHIIP